MELLIATASAGVLMGGMTSAIVVASHSLNHQSTTTGQQAELADAIRQMQNDLRHATGFTEQTATAVTFTVPDRSGNDADETIRYAWSGTAGDPLTVEYNGGGTSVVADGVTALNLDCIEQLMLAAPPRAARGVQYEGFEEAKPSGKVYTISIPTPADTEELDLLIAAVTIHDDQVGSTSAPAGWTLLTEEAHSGNHVTLSLWWKLADLNEAAAHTFGWGDEKEAYGWMMRFSGHDFSDPINAFVTKQGKFDEPPCLSVTTTTGSEPLMLRVGAFHNDEITEDDTGLLSHTGITMDGVSKISGGAGYRYPSDPNPHSQYEFQLTKSEDYVTATIAIAPEE